MYGINGTLKLESYNGSTCLKVDTLGDQGNSWTGNGRSFKLHSNKIKILGSKGSYRGDMAIDDIVVSIKIPVTIPGQQCSKWNQVGMQQIKKIYCF